MASGARRNATRTRGDADVVGKRRWPVFGLERGHVSRPKLAPNGGQYKAIQINLYAYTSPRK